MNWTRIKKILLGLPLTTAQEIKERLSVLTGLGVFASDALSSVAYASEEILLILALAGAAFFAYSWPIALAIASLIIIVIISYRQTVEAYPHGGGSFVATKENLGHWPGLVAGAALVVDFILTVAVSIAAGVAAITSAVPALFDYKVILSLIFLWLMTFLNLRGVKESGRILSAPVYLFLFIMVSMIVVGIKKIVGPGIDLSALISERFESKLYPAISLFLILRAFSAGCVALSGIEAISTGVSAFLKPEVRRAKATLTILGIILIFLFLGISFLALNFGTAPGPSETIISQIGRNVFGSGILYYLLQIGTCLILILAANTSFAGFPRLLFYLSREGFVPRQFMTRSERLVFSNGIVVLAILASALLIAFSANVHFLIPLYAVGVFLCFTLTQAGLVKFWLKSLMPSIFRKYSKAAINFVGAMVCGITLSVIVATKFIHGAWLAIGVIFLLILLFSGIKKHYENADRQLSLEDYQKKELPKNKTVIVIVSRLHRGTLKAIDVGRSLHPRSLTALHVNLDPENLPKFESDWQKWVPDVTLQVIASPYRKVIQPIIQYIDGIDKRWRDDTVIVVIPEFICRKFWHNFLHNQTALRLHYALERREDVEILSVPYQFEK